MKIDSYCERCGKKCVGMSFSKSTNDKQLCFDCYKDENNPGLIKKCIANRWQPMDTVPREGRECDRYHGHEFPKLRWLHREW